MTPLPVTDFDPSAWPNPAADGSTVLDPVTSGRVLVLLTTLIDYMEAQYAACAQTAPSAPSD